MRKESFYHLFEYNNMILDGGDKTINFEYVVIEKDIPELGLLAGTEYQECWFNLEKMTFHFINWNRLPNDKGVYQPNVARSVIVKQSDLAPLCVW